MTELKTDCQRFDGILYALPDRISEVLRRLPVFLRSSAYEIRLRAGGPVCITGDMGFYVSEEGVISTYLPSRPLRAEREELKEILLRITDGSLYTRAEELREGYLSMQFGGRAGVCGNFSKGICELTSVNIRIPRQLFGCARELVDRAEEGMLIAGPPGSGKTTLLRDLVRTLSYGGKRVCVVDSRGEICGRAGGAFSLDTGPNTDVISGKSKAQGVEIALRTMFPDYIAFDEVGSGRELELIGESFYSGVRILTTAHAATVKDILSRRVTRELLGGQVGCVALLSPTPGGRMELFRPEEVKRLA